MSIRNEHHTPSVERGHALDATENMEQSLLGLRTAAQRVVEADRRYWTAPVGKELELADAERRRAILDLGPALADASGTAARLIAEAEQRGEERGRKRVYVRPGDVDLAAALAEAEQRGRESCPSSERCSSNLMSVLRQRNEAHERLDLIREALGLSLLENEPHADLHEVVRAQRLALAQTRAEVERERKLKTLAAGDAEEFEGKWKAARAEVERLRAVEEAAAPFFALHSRDHDGCQAGDPCRLQCEALRAALATATQWGTSAPTPSTLASGSSPVVDGVAAYDSRAAWSLRTFGEKASYSGVVEHIRRELIEIEAEPAKLEEWVDVVMLAMDGAMRYARADGRAFWEAFEAKARKNEARKWKAPDAVGVIEHERGQRGDGGEPCPSGGGEP